MKTDKYGIPVIECATARDFLNVLDETNDLWGNDTWLFRGQNADWSLHPAAMRCDSLQEQYVQKNFEEADNSVLAKAQTKVANLLSVERISSSISEFSRRLGYKSLDELDWEVLLQRVLRTTLHSTFELQLVNSFQHLADRSALSIPSDRFPSPANRPIPLADILRFDQHDVDELLMVEPLRVIYALAQHHGLPTRLLDWTYRPAVAAFFAAHVDKPPS